MKTTLNIDDTVMQRLREEAARRGCTMSELVEAGLRRILDQPSGEEVELPPLPSWSSGRALVDVADREALFAIFDTEEGLGESSSGFGGHSTEIPPERSDSDEE
jgi:hypothetical protein